jgi:non-lysosomal glucosylceramidase
MKNHNKKSYWRMTITLTFTIAFLLFQNLNAQDNVQYLQKYEGSNLDHVAMPIGGIGTGTVSIDARGKLVDWEIMNQGAIGFVPYFNDHVLATRVAPFFSIRTKTANGSIDARMLEGAIPKTKLEGDWGCDELNSTFPRFNNSKMQTAYPIAKVELIDKTMPIKVAVKAFNPLIPGKTDDSSIPTAILEYTVINTSSQSVEVTICGTVPNYIGFDGRVNKITKNQNFFRNRNGLKGIFMSTNSGDSLDSRWGSMALTTMTDGHISYRTSWHPDIHWNGAVIDFWDDLKDDGMIKQFVGKEKTRENSDYNMLVESKGEMKDNAIPASLAVKITLAPGEQKNILFMLTWYFPKRIGWEGQPGGWAVMPMVNFYTRNYADAWDVAEKTVLRYNELKNATEEFVNSFTTQDVPHAIKDAALSNVSIMRSQTLFRDGDGYSFGWEGTGSIRGTSINPKGSRGGWGPGTCTHVWNYESTIPYLFGDVAMSMREVEFMYCTNPETGKMAHRVKLPLKTEKQTIGAAADGQLGCIIKMYREWQLSGNKDKLNEMYPNVKKALQFVWGNSKWDADRNGVIEGEHHNTMDVNYIGPNPEMGTWYLCALRAGEEMAKVMNDTPFEKECHHLFKTGSKWMDENMFNGEYYIQLLPESRNFQVGEAVLVHQMVGQQMAHMCGLGYLLEPQNVKKALESVMKYNYKENWDQHISTFRSYITKDEAGLMNAYYPEGKREARPFPYYSEVWTGLEYHTAAEMIFESMEKEGSMVVKSARARFDGTNRNPFDEGEFGHRYARAMSSWSPLIAYTRFHYNGYNGEMTIRAEEGNYYWSNGYAYGTIDVTKYGNKFTANLKVEAGSLELKTLAFLDQNNIEVNALKVKGETLIKEGNSIELK